MTILNETVRTVAYVSAPISRAGWIFIAIFAILAVTFIIAANRYKIEGLYVLGILCIATGLIGGTTISLKPVERKEIQVVFSDIDTLNDVLQSYEVIDVDGTIFTITEKTADTN